MSDTPPIKLKDYAVQLQRQAKFFANLSVYVGVDELEEARRSILKIRTIVIPKLDGKNRQSFELAIAEVELGIKVLLRTIHVGKDNSKQFFKDAKEVADFLKAAAAVLSLFPPALFLWH